MRKWLILLLAFIGIFAMAKAQCKFTVDEVEKETRLVAIQTNGQLELLHEDKVNVGSTLHFICSDKDIIQVTCNANNKFSKQLPIQNCANPPKATVEKISDATCSAETYLVGYKIGTTFLEVYRSCYKKSEVRAVVTSHTAYPYSLVTQRPDSAFTGDGIVTTKDAASFQTKNIYERFQELFDKKQEYITSKSDIIIDRGHLTPSADYLFPVNMRATFKYINAIPQFSTINRGNWKSIEDWVRKHIDANGSARIMTGAFDVLSLPAKNKSLVPMYLLAGKSNPIPKWIYKVVYGRSGTVVFVTYNNIYNSNPEVLNCKRVACPVQLKDTKESGFTFCCDPQDFHQNIWPHIH